MRSTLLAFLTLALSTVSAVAGDFGTSQNASNRAFNYVRSSIVEPLIAASPVPMNVQDVDRSNGGSFNLNNDHSFKLNLGQNLPMRKPESLRSENPYVERAQHGKIVWGLKLNFSH